MRQLRRLWHIRESLTHPPEQRRARGDLPIFDGRLVRDAMLSVCQTSRMELFFVCYTVIMMDHLIFFAFSLIVSPFTKMPFPLYTSGTLHFLIFAAN